MTEHSHGRLQRRYERLLRWYPPSHRERHGDEMLGVLLAAARPGQRHPGRAESANLITGALRIRLRAALDGSADQSRDTLALASLLLPLVLWGNALARFALDVRYDWVTHSPAAPPSLAGELLLPALLLTIPAVLGWRRATAVVTVLLASAEVALLVATPFSPVASAVLLGPLLLSALAFEAVALAASAGPRRGRAQLTGRSYLLAAGAAMAAGAIVALGWWLISISEGISQLSRGLGPLGCELAMAALSAIIVAALLPSTPVRRRLAVILLLPAYYLVFIVAAPAFGPLILLVAYLPVIVLPAAGILALRRRHARRLSADGQGAR